MSEYWHPLSGTLGRKGRVVAPPPPEPVVYGPVSYEPTASTSAGLVAAAEDVINDMPADLQPTNINLVPWTWATGTPMYSVTSTLGSNDVLVLPEDENPYLVDEISSRAGVWKEGFRWRKGAIGLGPGARIEFDPNMADHPHTGSMGGSEESMWGIWTKGCILANFHTQGRYIGGLPFSCGKINDNDNTIGPNSTVWRLSTRNHYGVDNHEPWETFGIATHSHDAAKLTFKYCHIDGSNPDTGNKEGSGGMHFSRGKDFVIQDCYVRWVRGHAFAFYARGGHSLLEDIVAFEPGGSPYRPEPWYTGGGGFADGSGINVEVSGTYGFNINRPRLILHKSQTGNTREHLNTLSTDVSSGTDGVSWGETGKTPFTIVDPITDVPMQIGASSGSGTGTYHGATIIEGRSVISVTGATLEDGTPANHVWA